MKIADVIAQLETLAHPSLQESYDNAGLLTGSGSWECSGIICTLDATEAVVLEAANKGCNLVVAHHPIIFSGLKRITGSNYVEQTIIAAIKNDIAIYAIHTNLDNVLTGVNHKIADRLNLVNRRVLVEKPNSLKKLVVFVPKDHAEAVRSAMFSAGGGKLGNYSECSFNTNGTGTFKAHEGAGPFVGEVGERHYEDELKIEVIFNSHLQRPIIKAMTEAHPYETVAYDVFPLANTSPEIGSGLVAELKTPLSETEVLHRLKSAFCLKIIRHTPLLNKQVSKIALCGGAGSFLTKQAIAAGAQMFVTGDVKYHEFFDADGKLVIADIGHWESEQFTIDLLNDFLAAKFPTFAVQKSEVQTNPVQYFS